MFLYAKMYAAALCGTLCRIGDDDIQETRHTSERNVNIFSWMFDVSLGCVTFSISLCGTLWCCESHTSKRHVTHPRERGVAEVLLVLEDWSLGCETFSISCISCISCMSDNLLGLSMSLCVGVCLCWSLVCVSVLVCVWACLARVCVWVCLFVPCCSPLQFTPECF